MFKNLFGKKDDGFFMQMDESKAAPAKVESKAPEKQAEASATPAAPPTDEAAPKAVAAPEAPKATKTSIKNKKKEKAESTIASVATAPAAATPQTVTNFATDYLIQPSSNSSRRRPGANMKGFVTMAREVKVKK